jgi:hypothetical protein
MKKKRRRLTEEEWDALSMEDELAEVVEKERAVAALLRLTWAHLLESR